MSRYSFFKICLFVSKASSNRLEIWPGYVTAVDEYEGGLQLQCDTSHRVLRTETVLDVMNDIMRMAKMRGDKDIQSALDKELIGN